MWRFHRSLEAIIHVPRPVYYVKSDTCGFHLSLKLSELKTINLLQHISVFSWSSLVYKSVIMSLCNTALHVVLLSWSRHSTIMKCRSMHIAHGKGEGLYLSHQIFPTSNFPSLIQLSTLFYNFIQLMYFTVFMLHITL